MSEMQNRSTLWAFACLALLAASVFLFRHIVHVPSSAVLWLPADWPLHYLFAALLGSVFLIATSEKLTRQRLLDDNGELLSPAAMQWNYDRRISSLVFTPIVLVAIAGMIFVLERYVNERNGFSDSYVVTLSLMCFMMRPRRKLVTDGPFYEVVRKLANRAGVPSQLKPVDERYSIHPSLVHRIEAIRRVAGDGI